MKQSFTPAWLKSRRFAGTHGRTQSLKKASIPLVLLLIHLVAVKSWAEPSRTIQNLRSGENQVILTYGTSLTEGGEWVKLLDDWLQSQSFPGKATLINKGLGGSTSNSHSIGKKISRDVISLKPSTVFIEYGMNDCIQRFADPSATPPRLVDAPVLVSLERFKENLAGMISRVREGSPDAEIFLMTMNMARNTAEFPTGGSFRTALPDYYAAVRAVGKDKNIVVIDTCQEWLRLGEKDPGLVEKLIPDGLHPNLEGSQLVTFPLVQRALLGE